MTRRGPTWRDSRSPATCPAAPPTPPSPLTAARSPTSASSTRERRPSAIDSAGRIVATGTITTFDGSTSSIGIARLLPDGTPNPVIRERRRRGRRPAGHRSASPTTSAHRRAATGSSCSAPPPATGASGRRVMRFTTRTATLDPAFGDGGIARFGKAFSRRLHGRWRSTAERPALLLAWCIGGTVVASCGCQPPGSRDARVRRRWVRRSVRAARRRGRGSRARRIGRAIVAATCACGPRGDDDMAVARLTTRRGRARLRIRPRRARLRRLRPQRRGREFGCRRSGGPDRRRRVGPCRGPPRVGAGPLHRGRPSGPDVRRRRLVQRPTSAPESKGCATSPSTPTRAVLAVGLGSGPDRRRTSPSPRLPLGARRRGLR